MKNTVLWQLRVEKNREWFDCFDFWCDYLTLSYIKSVDFLDEILFGVDFDNSNFWIKTFVWYDFTYTKFSTWIWYALNFTYSYNGVSIPIMQYVKFNDHAKHTTWKSAKISIYWSYFRLEQIWVFRENYIIDLLKTFSDEDPRIMRYDLRFDYFSLDRNVQIPDVSEICWYIHHQSTIQKWYNWDWNLIDWCVWNPNTWRYKIRYYDKKIDTDKKNKWVLYSDFVKYSSVHRLEIEFLRSFTRLYSLWSVHDLEKKIWSVLNLDWQSWAWRMFYKYDSSKEITTENRWRFFERYINLTKKLIKAWYNPYNLIEESIIWEYWKDKALWILEDFINNSSVYEIH